MARIPQNVIDEIREKSNIVEVIGQYVQLKKAGKNYVGLCPFHEEKTPSFSVAEDKQIFHCFGCGRGGNVFGFVEELEGLTFPEAVAKVAEIEQIPFAAAYKMEPTTQVGNSPQHALIKLHEKAKEVYHHMLVNTAAGQVALDYLISRGLTEELIKEFEIGFAPNERQFLRQVFANEKVEAALLAQSGLFVERENGELADRFYQRIMFPIHDAKGKTIGFSGRILTTPDFPGENQPKYLNSPETELFNKRQVLFNFDKARPIIRKENTVFLFEGFMDVIAAWQSGVKNGIASMGTSLTSQQIAAIERVAGEIVISYDGDKAGLAATDRAIGMLDEHSSLDLAILQLPEKLDPDEYVRKYGSAAFYELAYHGRETVFGFKMAYLRQNRNLGNEKEQLDYVTDLLHELAKVDSLLAQDRYLTQIATEFHLSRETLQQQLSAFKQKRRQEAAKPPQQNTAYEDAPQFGAHEVKTTPATQTVKRPLTQVERGEQLILYRLFNDNSLLNRLQQVELVFIHDEYQTIYFMYENFIESFGSFSLPDFLDYLTETTIKNKVIEIAYLNVPQDSSEEEIKSILRLFQKARIAEKINQKKFLQQEASQLGNMQQALELAVEIIDLTKQLQQA
ncbi:DNA primase [Enterococcus dispar]|uniref:DNA primase n=1 Tax=Enterococcus dispar TaxID=44009 RepID=UPI00189F399C|nr:DNA primase [Enterococcus dispar]MCU7356313.1 DNA primase [Enterococcus dispar]WCG33603.1 DNA primase [Enterococcus dispar]